MSGPLRARMLLTVVWLGAFFATVGIVLSYAAPLHRTLILLPDETTECIKPLAIFYGSYLAVIIGFWFAKPFPAPSGGHAERFRRRLAITCAIALNAIVLYFVSHAYISPGDTQPVLESVKAGVKLGGWLSFLVAPANAFYFGTKAGG